MNIHDLAEKLRSLTNEIENVPCGDAAETVRMAIDAGIPFVDLLSELYEYDAPRFTMFASAVLPNGLCEKERDQYERMKQLMLSAALLQAEMVTGISSEHAEKLMHNAIEAMASDQ